MWKMMFSNLFSWTREAKNANAEIDFLFQIGNMVFPIEVKDVLIYFVSNNRILILREGLQRIPRSEVRARSKSGKPDP